MMRIAYLVNHPLDREDGVVRKIGDQVEAWKRLGATVKIFSIGRPVPSPVLEATQYPFPGWAGRKFFLRRALYDDISRFAPDVMYMRHVGWSRTIDALSRMSSAVMEINSDDIAEYREMFRRQRSLRWFGIVLSNRVFRHAVLSRMSGLVFVTDELSRSPHFQRYGDTPKAVIPNGINTRRKTFRKTSPPESERIGLFFIGSPGQPWQGIDRVVAIAWQLPEFDFHIVGEDGRSSENVFYYGYLNASEYQSVLAKCHVCIGTLALDRKQMTEGCPLKVREYLSMGYPVIIAYHDTAFTGGNQEDVQRSLLELPVNPFNPDIEMIRSFVNRNRDTVVPISAVEPYIGSDSIERRRLDFMATL